ncbi:MAG TPA: transaldolase [Acidimicrobiales bacterium]|nr:transaldolase [Acidimicrobiales bacterium]
MTKLRDLYETCGQSPWLDNLSRPAITSGDLAARVSAGIRGVTSNPTIFQKAISGSDAYDEQFRAELVTRDVEAAYWELVIDDITNALAVLRPVYDEAKSDGFVSIEVSPAIAHDTAATITDARSLHERIAQPNLMVKIPATAAGIPAIKQMTAEGRNINITLIFSLDRYDAVIDAYISGLAEWVAGGGDAAAVNSVASFFVSRVDTEVDRRLDAIGSPEALGLRGKAAVAQAKLAYQLFADRFGSDRWRELASNGARLQRPLWASTSTKNPAYPDLLYVDTLIGPDSVNTLPDATIDAFVDHGVVHRTITEGVEEAAAVLEGLDRLGVDMADVGQTLEDEGVAAFVKSYDELLQALSDKANAL